MSESRQATGNVEEMTRLALGLVQQGRAAAAADVARQLIEAGANSPELWFCRAAGAVEAREFRDALAWAEKAIGLQPRLLASYQAKAKVQHALGLYDALRALARTRPEIMRDTETRRVVDMADAARERLVRYGYRHPHGTRVSMADVSFVLPLYVESEDRLKNLEIVLRFLAMHFDAPVIVVEDVKGGTATGAEKVAQMTGARHVAVTDNDSPYCHKTWLSNRGIAEAETPYVVVHDTDVVMAPANYEGARELAAEGAGVAFPYSGVVIDVGAPEFGAFAKSLDVRDIDALAPGNRYPGVSAYGGAVMLNRDAISASGGFNETIVAWGMEDREMIERLTKLGRPAVRVDGPLYHLRHVRTVNSDETHPFWGANVEALEAMRAMDRGALEEAVAAGRFRRPLITMRDVP